MGELAPGSMVTANVRLLELIARGGMGSVWVADHLGLDTKVAVKFIKPEIVARDSSVRERFKREASIAAQIRSIHAVQCFDHGMMHDGTPYIVMELLEGESVTDRIERDGPLPAREAAIVVSQVAKVLHRAHSHGIVHRDIKPDNIYLIDSDYELFAKVLDFGIAKQTNPELVGQGVTKTGIVVGTPEFMSPEQAVSSKDIDYRSDLYSLAVVAYYMLTADLPFDTEAAEPVWMQMAAGNFPPPSSRVAGLPVTVDAWFKRAMHPKPEGRYSSAKVMAQVLMELIEVKGYEVVDELSTSQSADSRRRIVDELSSISDMGRPPPSNSDPSHPGMYDLFSPDSGSYGSAGTLVMEEPDHRFAEARAKAAAAYGDLGNAATLSAGMAGAWPNGQAAGAPADGGLGHGASPADRSGAYRPIGAQADTSGTFAAVPPSPYGPHAPTASNWATQALAIASPSPHNLRRLVFPTIVAVCALLAVLVIVGVVL
jgi:serine/threonine-protein kinase